MTGKVSSRAFTFSSARCDWREDKPEQAAHYFRLKARTKMEFHDETFIENNMHEIRSKIIIYEMKIDITRFFN